MGTSSDQVEWLAGVIHALIDAELEGGASAEAAGGALVFAVVRLREGGVPEEDLVKLVRAVYSGASHRRFGS